MMKGNKIFMIQDHCQNLLHRQENVLGSNHRKALCDLVEGTDFAWFFYSDIHFKDAALRDASNLARHSFVHEFWANEQQTSQYFPLFEPLVFRMADIAGVELNKILRMKINMSINVGKTIEGVEHTDGNIQEQDGLKWFTGIYYLSSSDGCTTIHLPDGNKEMIEPIADTAVVFDGHLRHAAQLPIRNNRRFVVNVNFLGA